MADEPTVWKIALNDELRATMPTNPTPYWAITESEKDWVLSNLVKRPREDYDVVEVPGPLERAVEDEKVRWKARRAELWAERKKP